MSAPIQQPRPKLIPLNVVANRLDCSVRTAQIKCKVGFFKTAVKPTGGQWKVDSHEVEAKLIPQNGK
jgi:hypothetical protein